MLEDFQIIWPRLRENYENEDVADTLELEEGGRETSQDEMASRQDWVVSSQCTGMMNHACNGSRSKATMLFKEANEASTVTNSESEMLWLRRKQTA